MTNYEILNCFKLQNTLKKKGVALNEINRKSLNEMEKHQMIMELKAYIDGQNPTNLNRIPCAPKVIQNVLVQLYNTTKL